MSKTENITKLVKILVCVLVMVTSMFVFASKAPDNRFVLESLESLEEDKDVVMAFSASTMSLSVLITTLPDDIATPLADIIAEFSKYCVFLLAVIFAEKLVVLEGFGIAFSYMIPAGCLLHIVGILTDISFFKSLANKLLIIAISVVLVVPFSTHFVDTVGGEYLDYVYETLEEAEDGATKAKDIMESDDEDQSILDKMSDALKNAMAGVSDLVTYFKNLITKCINVIAILFVTTFVLPVVILFFFKWLITELFKVASLEPGKKKVKDKEASAT
ncbi:MAG: hypothetical protein HUJ71_02770 [Pseudobutyrivibrio sp.]|nr:hypothetical protein [Pseudobutyrivibrio sp.]